MTLRLVLVHAVLIVALLIPFAQAHTISVATTTYFGFGSDSYIKFSEAKSFNTIYYVSNYWYFDGYGLQLSNANMTITKFFANNQLTFTLSSSGTSTTKIYCGSKGEPASVTGATSWDYDGSNLVLTITKIHSSIATIKVTWIPEWNQIKSYGWVTIGLLSLVPTILCGAAILALLSKQGEISPNELAITVGAMLAIFVALFVGIVIINTIINVI